jgi:hypothetical protein
MYNRQVQSFRKPFEANLIPSGKRKTVGLGQNIMITEISDPMLDRDADEESRPTFELMFKIFYSENDFINLKINTYFRPKYTDSGELKTPNYPLEPPSHPEKDVEASEPIFIGCLTSQYLFERASICLQSQYRSKQYMDRYGYQPQSLQTFNG